MRRRRLRTRPRRPRSRRPAHAGRGGDAGAARRAARLPSIAVTTTSSPPSIPSTRRPAARSTLLTGFLDYYRGRDGAQGAGPDARRSWPSSRPVGADDRRADQAPRVRRGHLVRPTGWPATRSATRGRRSTGRSIPTGSSTAPSTTSRRRCCASTTRPARAAVPAVADVGDLDAVAEVPQSARRDTSACAGSSST